MMDHNESQNLMFSMVRDKSILKQDIFNNIILNFKVLKQVLKEVGDDLKDRIDQVDDRDARSSHTRMTRSGTCLNVKAFRIM